MKDKPLSIESIEPTGVVSDRKTAEWTGDKDFNVYRQQRFYCSDY